MFARALLAFLVLPGIAAIIAPPILASADPWKGRPFMPGLFIMLAGSVMLIRCVRDFYVSGKGTLAPWNQPRQLVVIGLYRYMRNPMYVGVVLLVLGWSIYFTSPVLAVYSVLLAVGFHIRVLTHEEPWLGSQFGAEWDRYRTSVPRWLPRSAPWKDGP